MTNQELMLELMGRRQHGTPVSYQAMAIAAYEDLRPYDDASSSVADVAEFILQSARAGATSSH